MAARPASGSFLSLNAPNVILSVMKLAESSNDLIVRMYETDGKEANARLDMPFVKARWSGHLRPFEIKTLRIAPPFAAVREVNGLEQ